MGNRLPSAGTGLSGGVGFNCQCMDAASKLGFQSCIDQAVALQPAPAGEGRRDDVNAKMGSTTGILAGAVCMPLMHMRFIVDFEALGRKSLP